MTTLAIRPAPSAQRVRRLDAGAAALLVVMWSSGFVGADLGTRFASADTLLAWRYVAASAILGAWALARRRSLHPRAWSRLVVVGLLSQCAYLGGVVHGVGAGVPAGTAALVASLQPLVVAAVAGPLLGERSGGGQRLGLALGVVGVGMVVAGDLGSGYAGPVGYALVVGGMLGLSSGTLLERWWQPQASVLESLTVQTMTGAVFFVTLAAVGGDLAAPADPRFWGSVAWVVVLSSFGGYGSYLLVLRRGGATRVSALLLLTPPVTTAWTFAMFGTAPALLALPGAVVCAVAVWLVLRRRQDPAPA